MSVLNHAAVEALCSATYLGNYLECMESLPEEMQRHVTQLRELDGQYNDLLDEMNDLKSTLNPELESTARRRTLFNIQCNLVKCQEIGDEKIQLVSQIIEVVENRSRQLHQDLENLNPITGGKDLLLPPEITTPAPATKQTKVQQNQQPKQQSVSQQKQQQYNTQETTRQSNVTQPRPSQQSRQTQQNTTPQPQHTASTVTSAVDNNKTSGKRQRRQVIRTEEEKKEDKDLKPKKKKKRKVKKEKASSPMDIPIDPDEPIYCLCEQVSYGEMIGCDNDSCKMEWFHFNCVNLTQKPKGKWYCPNCRGETSKVPRKDLK